MIVTSMRCYLNILTQLMTKENLLNAQYYICDKTGVTVYNQDYNYSMEDGMYMTTLNNPIDRASEYLVEYASSASNLSIEKWMTSLDIDIDKISKSKDPLARYYTYINTKELMLSLYQKAISKIRKDKLFIFIFMDEMTVRYCGDMVCELLSQKFGQDVTFIDPQYRPYVRGRLSYVGNKQQSEKIIEELKHTAQIAGYMAAVSNAVYDNESTSNIVQFLTAFESVEELINFHNLLWPHDDLPKGTYTRADVEEIIIQKTLYDMSNSRSRNLNMNILGYDY